ncbi:MAG: hypothetical protein K6E87_02240 [bacterium]|nr:hypothetical protein [bacterium]
MKNILKIILAFLGVGLIISLVSKFAINKKNESEVKTKVIPVVSIEAEQFDDDDTFALDEEEDKVFKENDSIYVSLPDVDGTLLFRKNSFYDVDDISYSIFNCVLKNTDNNVVENYEIIYSSNCSCDLSITQTNFSESVEQKQLYKHNIFIEFGAYSVRGIITLITDSNSVMESEASIISVLYNRGFTSGSKFMSATGRFMKDNTYYYIYGCYASSSELYFLGVKDNSSTYWAFEFDSDINYSDIVETL